MGSNQARSNIELQSFKKIGFGVREPLSNLQTSFVWEFESWGSREIEPSISCQSWTFSEFESSKLQALTFDDSRVRRV